MGFRAKWTLSQEITCLKATNVREGKKNQRRIRRTPQKKRRRAEVITQNPWREWKNEKISNGAKIER